MFSCLQSKCIISTICTTYILVQVQRSFETLFLMLICSWWWSSVMLAEGTFTFSQHSSLKSSFTARFSRREKFWNIINRSSSKCAFYSVMKFSEVKTTTASSKFSCRHLLIIAEKSSQKMRKIFNILTLYTKMLFKISNSIHFPHCWYLGD